MRQRWSAITMLAAILMVLLALASPVGATTYTDPQGQFSFTLPDGFTSVPNPHHAATFLLNADPVNKTAAGNLIVDIIPADATISVPVPHLFDDQNNPIAPVVDQDLTLGGQPAHRSDFVSTDGTLYRVMIATRNNNTIYSLIFDTAQANFNAYAPQLQTILTSFTFGATPNGAPASPAIAQPAAQPAPITAPTG